MWCVMLAWVMLDAVIICHSFGANCVRPAGQHARLAPTSFTVPYVAGLEAIDNDELANRSSPWIPRSAAKPRLHPGCHPRSGPRDRREHRDFFHVESLPSSAIAL